VGEKKRFHRGEDVVVRWRTTSGSVTELPGRVVQMRGYTVVVKINGRNETIDLASVRKVTDDEWLSQSVIAPAPVAPIGPPRPPPAPRSKAPTTSKPLSANLGEIIMAKTATPTTTPPFFDPSGHARDPQGIGAAIRSARTTNGIEPKTMAKMLRIQLKELDAIESGEVIPDDGVVLRVSDVLDCPLDPLSKALDYTKEKVREAEERRLAALELGRKTQEAEARQRAEAEAMKEKKAQEAAASRATVKPTTTRTASETPRRTLEDFGERLMDVSPVPVDATRRKQWWTCARILFELEGQ